MKIVHIEDFFHPNAGYQINILPKYLVKKGMENFILTSEIDNVPENLTSFFGRENLEKFDKEYEKLTGVKIIRVPVKRFLSSRAVFGKELDRVVDQIQPDIVYVHGNDTLIGMKYIWKQKRLKFALISDSHMLEMASVNRFNKLFRGFYKTFVTPRIVENKLTIIRTQDDPYVEKCLGIPLEQAPWISYGSDTLLFHPDQIEKKQFRKENSIPEDAFVIIYAGKLDESKGGLLLAKTLQQKFDADRKVVFVVVGNASGEYGRLVEKQFATSENTILRFPTQRYVDLAHYFKGADLAIFPRQCSLSFYDVQACGLPVISEDNNINVARCSYQNGMNFKQEDVNDFRNKIQFCINMDRNSYAEMQDRAFNYIKSEYDYSRKADEYMAEILKAIKFYKEHTNG